MSDLCLILGIIAAFYVSSETVALVWAQRETRRKREQEQ